MLRRTCVLTAALGLAACGQQSGQPFGEVGFSVDPPPGLTGDSQNAGQNESIDAGFDDNPIPRPGQIYPGTEDPISRPLE
jgi:hypothetical protein